MPRGAIAGRPARPGAKPALGVAGLCLIALALTWIVAELVPAAQLRDSAALRDFELLSRPHVDQLANALLHLLDPLLFICWGIALVTVALVRRRPRVALAVALVMALAPFTAETLKPLLAHTHVQIAGATHIAAASWPSGHSTAALALVLCAVLVAPVHLRPLVTGLGAAYAAAVGCSLADPRLAHAERRLRRLPRGGPVDGAGRGRPARGRSALAARALSRALRSLAGRRRRHARRDPRVTRAPRPRRVCAFTARLRMNRRSESLFR